MSQNGNFNHLFTIVDNMVSDAIAEVEEEGGEISCRKGCTHCCYLLVEVSWEEAVELAKWVGTLPSDRKASVLERIRNSATDAREFFRRSPESAQFAEPLTDDIEIPEDTFGAYFEEKGRACPVLVDGICSAYDVRPTSCRLHMVSSAPEFCARECDEEEEYDIPEEIEALKENAAHPILAMEQDGRWGHLAIMVEHALKELEIADISGTPEHEREKAPENSSSEPLSAQVRQDPITV